MISTVLGPIARGGVLGPRFLFPLLLLLLIGGLVGWLVVRRVGADGERSALRTLQARFAVGEIDQAEFEHRRAVLVGAESVPPRSGRVPSSAPSSTSETAQPSAPADAGGEQ